MRTGQLFERLWMTAVAELLPPEWTPQHLFRAGFGSSEETSRTPRRPLDDVVV